MLHAILNKYWKQHPTLDKKQLNTNLPAIQIRWAKHVEHYLKNKDKHINNILLGIPICGLTKLTFISSVYDDDDDRRRWK